MFKIETELTGINDGERRNSAKFEVLVAVLDKRTVSGKGEG
jgi:hypothetical protein